MILCLDMNCMPPKLVDHIVLGFEGFDFLSILQYHFNVVPLKVPSNVTYFFDGYFFGLPKGMEGEQMVYHTTFPFKSR